MPSARRRALASMSMALSASMDAKSWIGSGASATALSVSCCATCRTFPTRTAFAAMRVSSNDHTLAVADHTRVEAKSIVIATGSQRRQPGFVQGPGRPPDHQRRRLRLARSAQGRGRDRPGNHRPGTGSGAASPGCSCCGARPGRPRRPHQRPGDPQLTPSRRSTRNSRWSPTRTLPQCGVTATASPFGARCPMAPSNRAFRLRSGRHRPHAQCDGHRPRQDHAQARRQRRAVVRSGDHPDRERRRGKPDFHRRRCQQLHPAPPRGGRRGAHRRRECRTSRAAASR